MSEYPEKISISPTFRQKRQDDFFLVDRKAFPGKGTEYVRADLLEALEAKLAKAIEALAYIDGRICWELNPSNYDHQSVCDMNADWCEVGTLAADTLAALKGQNDDQT